jgi:hypothetical protein
VGAFLCYSMGMMTQAEISQNPRRTPFVLVAHIEALEINAERDMRAVVDAAHHQALMEDAYRSCRVYGMGRR